MTLSLSLCLSLCLCVSVSLSLSMIRYNSYYSGLSLSMIRYNSYYSVMYIHVMYNVYNYYTYMDIIPSCAADIPKIAHIRIAHGICKTTKGTLSTI